MCYIYVIEILYGANTKTLYSTSAAASSAKKQKQDRIVEENNKDRFSFSEAKQKTGASMRTLEPNFLSFKSFPKMIKNNTTNNPRNPANIKAVFQLKS